MNTSHGTAAVTTGDPELRAHSIEERPSGTPMTMRAAASTASVPDTSARYDVIVVGASPSGLSVALQLGDAGLERVRVVESRTQTGLSAIAKERGVDLSLGETVLGVDVDDDGVLIVSSTLGTYATSHCVLAVLGVAGGGVDPAGAPAGGRVHHDAMPALVAHDDVLVVGATDWAIELAAQAFVAGANVVLAAGDLDPGALSEIGLTGLNELEGSDRFTTLYGSKPHRVTEVFGFPLAEFSDDDIPHLQFDHVVYASHQTPSGTASIAVSDAAVRSGRIATSDEPNVAELLRRSGRTLDPSMTSTVAQRRRRLVGALDRLRAAHYNATITSFERAHDDLWILRVRPDDGELVYRAGQYATLGLGYWEDRVDSAVDPELDQRWDKLLRRSYSISSRIFDEHGYLTDDTRSGELEFYIVRVAPSPEHVPGLTPRLALKRPGDRIFLGGRTAGRYTLGHVTNPDSTVVLLATGTGEAPHNAMVVELLQRGHRGPIASAVSVRKWHDLAYVDKHRELAKFHPNYHYLPIPTRESDVPRRYLQDLITSGEIESHLGRPLDPANAHVFICGNPIMIGLPQSVDGMPQFPAQTGVLELLTRRGFQLDRPGHPGNIHIEEYW